MLERRRAMAADGKLQERVAAAVEMLRSCELCPRKCGVNRLEGDVGFCRTGRQARVASYAPHFGEERPLVGRVGSGTIFFSACNLGCAFCQNWDIAHRDEGQEVSARELARMMVALQAMGCANVNVVTPTHVMPQILEAFALVVDEGLRVPLVWNCGGYESVQALRLPDGIVDIYMPDAKFMASEPARRLCKAPDYPERMQETLTEMHRQVGDLAIGPDGLATRGLLVRHLVLPNGEAGTRELARFLYRLSPQTYVNVMAQYRPLFRAGSDALIGRALRMEEYRAAVEAMVEEGLTRLDGVGV